MHRFLAPMLLALSLLPAAASAAEAPKIGYVDIRHLIENSPQKQAASAELEEQFGPQQQKLQSKQQEFQSIQQKLQKDGLVMEEAERKELEQRLQELKREIQRAQQAYQEELNIQRNNAFKQIRQAVMEAVQDLARDEGYDLVVGQGALYASEAVNLTDRVLERMKDNYETAQSD